MAWQQTLAETLTLTGIGLHTGRPITMELVPATVDAGITFVRTDLPGQPEIRAEVAFLVDTTLATTLGVPHRGSMASISTVEHLLAALRGLGIDNVRAHVHGPEVPVMDGSAAPFVAAMLQVGIERQRRPRRVRRVMREVRVADGHKVATLSPHPGLRITCSVEFDHPLIPSTPCRFDAETDDFAATLAPARTFGFRRDVEALQARGLALGGSLDNAVVIDDYQVLNPDGLRFADEFVRHKVLDAVGDLALFGMPVLGRLRLHCSGHALNTALVRAALADPSATSVVELTPQATAPSASGWGCSAGVIAAAKGLA